MLFAPGYYDSYSSEAFPSIMDAITEKNWDEVKFQIRLVSLMFDGAKTVLSGQFMQ